MLFRSSVVKLLKDTREDISSTLFEFRAKVVKPVKLASSARVTISLPLKFSSVREVQ